LIVCVKEGFGLRAEVTKGTKLEVSAQYLFDACELLMEVVSKLTHTLWRKVFPDELEQADKELNQLIFEYLQREAWQRAITLSEFFLEQKKSSTEQNRKIGIVNYAIGLKGKGDLAHAREVLKGVDWSACSHDFRLAYEVLMENFAGAAEIMKRMGREGELIRADSYQEWPLFRGFRENREFREAYEVVYGHSFVSVLQKNVEKQQASALAEGKSPPSDPISGSEDQNPKEGKGDCESVHPTLA
jgi:hypothetical protein